MIGRHEPLERIGSLLGRAREGSAGALVIRGEAGVGKTALLGAVTADAAGFQVTLARGIESEMTMEHAALLQLVDPFRHHLEAVPEPQRRALESALGWGPPVARHDRFLVAAAALSMLALAAEEQPVLVTVDDFHWLDSGSAAAVLFAARRLASDAVAILIATRDGAPSGTTLDGLDVLDLEGLRLDEVEDLLPGNMAPHVVAQLFDGTRGNPLALIEAGSRLTPAQRLGTTPLPEILPAGRLQAVYEPLLADLSAAARSTVLVVAVTRDDNAAPVSAALELLGIEAEHALLEAEESGVLAREPGTVRFRHPLLRSTVLSLATASERRAAHAALGEAMPPDRQRDRTWHLAEAATTPDEALADDLEELGNIERERFGYAAASAALERAARLSEDPVLAASRLACAVEDAGLAGDMDRARRLSERLLADGADQTMRGRALAVLGFVEQWTGSVPRSAHLLEQAADHTDGALRVRVLAELALTRHLLGDYVGLASIGERLEACADRDDPTQRLFADFYGGLAALAAGEFEKGLAKLAEALEFYAAEPVVRNDPRFLVPATLAVGVVGIESAGAGFLEGRLAHARSHGALTVLVPTLSMFAYGQAEMLNDHAAAFASAGESVELGAELGFVAAVAPAVEMLAWQHAARGFHDEAQRELDRAAELVTQAGTASVAAHHALARAFCALCRDAFDEIVALLEPRLELDGGRGAMGEPLGIAPLLVEAYVAVGRTEDAARLTERLAALIDGSGPPIALTARCQGLTDPDADEAALAFTTAIEAHKASMDTGFELARTELLFGAHLRRCGQRAAARPHLRSAHERFVSMDLSLWVKRSSSELAATGETVRSRRRTGDEPLTSQETRVALLVAQGLTNREVAAALFVSNKTVEYHLSNVYRKRGVRSRVELARAMAATSTEEPLA